MEISIIVGKIISTFHSNLSSVQQAISQIPESQAVLISIAVIIIIAALFAFILHSLKQEIIPAYILAGLVVGPLCLGLIKNTILINAFAEIGIAFLLFVAGMEISISKLKETGKTSITAGLIQILIIGTATFFISNALGFARLEAFYLALILAFSSTILVVKVFADKHELNTLHSRIAISILMIQDIIAILALALLSEKFTINLIFISILKLILLLLIAFFLNKTVLKPLFRKAAHSTELLFVVSLAFVFLFTALTYILELSIIIGAFVAGLAIANLPYKSEIESKIRPVRDFFAIIFFVSLGMMLTPFNIIKIIIPLIVFLVLVILFKPFITSAIIRISGYKPRTASLTSFSLAQISEFSLILALQGLILGILTQTTFNLVVLLAIITMGLTPYMIHGSSFLYSKIIKPISFIEKIPTNKEKLKFRGRKKKTILLLGCHRMGTVFLKQLNKLKHRILVIDFNPTIIKALAKQQISCVYGDAANTELFEQLPLSKIKIIISTIPKKEINMLLIKYFKILNPKIFITVTAEKVHDALDFYKAGADYVIVPMLISGEKSLKLIKKLNRRQFAKLKKEHISYLHDLHKFLY